jgi:hypothetical protein
MNGNVMMGYIFLKTENGMVLGGEKHNSCFSGKE